MFSGQELSLAEIEAVADSLAGLVYHVSLAGGEPTLRDDLPDIARAYVLRSRARSLLLVSNGSQPERLVAAAQAALRAGPKVDAIVSLSIDDIGERHDALRGLPGLFDRVCESYRQVLPLKPEGLSVNCNFTLTQHNQDRGVDILHEAADLFPEASLSLTAVRGRTADADATPVDPKRYRAAADFLHTAAETRRVSPIYENFSVGRRVLAARKELLEDHVQRMLEGKPARGRCYAGWLTGVLMADGGVYPCELLDEPMGNVRDAAGDFPAVWQTDAAKTVRAKIWSTRCACTYECAWGTNLLFGLRHVPRLLAAIARQRLGGPCGR